MHDVLRLAQFQGDSVQDGPTVTQYEAMSVLPRLLQRSATTTRKLPVRNLSLCHRGRLTKSEQKLGNARC